jgi:hypothetical protein
MLKYPDLIKIKMSPETMLCGLLANTAWHTLRLWMNSIALKYKG